jgi:hypothetical protein
MRRRNTKIDVTMFPFLSVLCGLIGVLVLFLVNVLTTRVMEAQDPGPPPPPPVKQHGTVDGEEGLDSEQYEQLQRQIDDLGNLLAVRVQERADVGRRLLELEASLAEVGDQFSLKPATVRPTPVNLDEPEAVNFVPDTRGREVKQRPVYVEINSDGYLVRPGKKIFPVIEMRKSGAQEKYHAVPELQKILKSVDDRRDTQYLLVLVHPNGTGAYKPLRRYLLQEFPKETKIPQGNGQILVITTTRIGIGVEPFSRDWEFIAESGKP